MKNFYIDINAETLGDVLAFTHYMFQKTLGIGKQSEFLEGNYNLSDRLGYYGIIQTPMSLSEEYQRLKDRFTLITKENLDFIEEAKKITRKRFAGNTRFLKRELKAEILLSIFFLSKHTNNNTFIKDFVTLLFKLRLDILKEKYQNGYEEIIQFIDYALDNKDNIPNILNNINVLVNEDMPKQLIFGEKTLEDIYFSDKYGLTHYDREIHDAIVSLYHQGHEYITPQMIFFVLSGYKKDKNSGIYTKIDDNKREEILASARRIRDTMVEIPMKALPLSFIKNGWQPLKVIHKISLLPCVILNSAKLNGKKVGACICLIDEPPLSYTTWSHHKRFLDSKRAIATSLLEDRGNERFDGLQKRLENLSIIGTVDIKMLNTPLSNTSENIVLKCYFLRSIAIAKRKGDKRIKITFHEVYCHLGIPEVSDKGSQGALRVKYYDTRDKVIKCLDFWKKSNLIKNYSNNTKAITIIL